MICDDGIGFDPGKLHAGNGKRGGLGILGMSERSELLDGSFKIESQPGKGTKVFITIPINEAHNV
jgi:two-component system sensor histidine kinase DegS